MEQEYKQQFKEFCEIFKGLNVAQAMDKADKLGLGYKWDMFCDLVDIDYKDIVATVYDFDGIGYISITIEAWNKENTAYELMTMEG